MKITNESPIEHRCDNGTVFHADRADLQTGVTYASFYNVDTDDLASDFFQFGAWHAKAIHPKLDSFQGYDCVTFTRSI